MVQVRHTACFIGGMNSGSTAVVVGILGIAGEYLAGLRASFPDDLAYASEVWRGLLTVAHAAGRDLDKARALARGHLAGWTPDLEGVVVTPGIEAALQAVQHNQRTWQRVLDLLG